MIDWIRPLYPSGPAARPAAWLLALLLLGQAVPSAAHIPQEGEQGEQEGGAEGREEEGQEEGSGPRIAFHAFLNLAYAASDGNQIFGIPEGGTTDYRNVVMQIRYEITPRDIVYTQLSHERLGRSTINEARDEVELEWAFYERRLTDTTAVKLGKMQLPLGIYNEIRDVGTLLPLYAPPYSFYLENFTSENIEGVMLSHSFAPSSDWNLEADLYYGGWDRIEQESSSGRVVEARVENGFGTQLWLNTPIPDLRFGLAALRFDLEGGLNQVGETDAIEAYALSAAATFGRVHLHAEGIQAEAPFRFGPQAVVSDLVYRAYYGQVVLDLTPKWSLTWQSELADLQLGSGTPRVDSNEDHALGLAYRFRYNLVAKAELHQNEGFLVENEPPFVTRETRYGILSWSVSF
jgi:hypothetical protein